jgi:hypothetical protein
VKTARIVMILAVALQGCGYTAGAILPNNIRTIYVDDFQNSISFDTSESYQFQPGVEIDITNAIINRYVFDGNLRIARPENADAILTGELIDYVKDPVRFADDNENVEKYRLTLIVRMKLVDQRNDEVLFYEPSFTGDTLYFIAGSDATTEDAALTDAIADLAKNVVDRTIEDW